MARRRVGQMRRDAALDAMRIFGFDDSLIRKKLNELLKVYGKDNWGFIEADGYKVLSDSILESIVTEEPEQNPVTDIGNQSRPHEFDLNEIPDEENFTEFHRDLQVTNQPDHEDTRHVTGATDDPENQEGTEYIIEPDVPLIEEMSDQVLPVENGELANDIMRRKPCFGWIGDDEDNELIILVRSTQ
ncbi:uncharacterized protein LOC141688898 [Apium graveolens]|uniref:uncharacterized protein LOC141688898 n=1 Tax=Apium graveolens TaxID=4045 RepID=UPI003D7B7637